jgi:drug/metabolite transporter (DMT)-like permease
MKPLEWLMLVLLSILWGGSFFFSKLALAELAPFTVVLGRVAIATLALYLVVRATGQRMPRSPKIWGQFLVMGVLNNLIPFSLIFWGQTHIGSGLASILNATTPLWTVLLAHVLTKDERLTTSKIVGVLVGLAGAAVVIGLDALRGVGSNVLAQFAILGATLSYAFAGIWGKRFKGISPLVTAAGQVTCTTVLMVPIVLLVDRPWTLPGVSLQTLGALAGLGLLSTALAYVLYFSLLARAGATNALLVTLLIPVSVLLLAAAVLGETLDLRHLLGMALIGLGLLVMDGRLLAYLKTQGQLTRHGRGRDLRSRKSL